MLAHDDGHPFLEDRPSVDSAADEAEEVEQHLDHLANLGESANDLAEQRWAVIAPEGADGDRLISLVRPLLDRRSEQQGTRAQIIRVPPGMDAQRSIEWKRDEYPEQYKKLESKRPLYVLLLGDLDGVSLSTQQVLAIDGLPGRLACSSDEGYEAYVHKVLSWERTPARQSKPRSVFYTVHDRTSATVSGYERLIRPCLAMCQDYWQNERFLFPAHSIEDAGESEPEPQDFLDMAAARHPTVMLSLSHGMGPPRGRAFTPTEARERQGAMHFGREGAILPSDISSAPFLPGGLWFYFACFGAGTPSESAYHHWMTMLRQNDMDTAGPLGRLLAGLSTNGGFTSGIAQAALANPNGPLAMIGHMDLAWSYSYDEIQLKGGTVTSTNRAENFFEILAKMVKGNRVGMVFLEMQRILSNVSKGIITQYNRRKRLGGNTEGVDATEILALGNLWMFYQDLCGYVVLGDPAVRLPLPKADNSMRRGGLRDMFARAAEESLSEARTASGQGDLDWLDRAEQAFLEAALKRTSIERVSGEPHVSPRRIRHWARIYCDAGRQALADAMRGSDE